jgi:hypothetical protein
MSSPARSLLLVALACSAAVACQPVAARPDSGEAAAALASPRRTGPAQPAEPAPATTSGPIATSGPITTGGPIATSGPAATPLPDQITPTSGPQARAGAPARSAEDDAGPCSTDAECGLSRVAAGGCCATLCAPRPVTAHRAAELARAEASCRGCALPLCAPQPTALRATCSQHRCRAAAESLE